MAFRRLDNRVLIKRDPYADLLPATLLRNCDEWLAWAIEHLNTHEGEPLACAHELEQVTQAWTRDFVKLENHRVDDATDEVPSVCDGLFVLRCFLLACSQPLTYKNKSGPDDLVYLMQAVHYWSCQHTPETFAQVPSDPPDLEARIVDYVVRHSQKDPPLKAPDPESERRLQALQLTPPRLREVKATTHDLTLVPLHQAVPKEPEEPPEPGLLFRSGHGAYFLAICSRVLSQLVFQDRLFLRFELRPEPIAYPPRAMDDIKKWFETLAGMETSQDFSVQFTTVCLEHVLPVGARESAGRRHPGVEQPNLEHATPYSLLYRDLGVHTAKALLEMTREEVPAIARDEKHLFHDLLVLLMFDAYLKSEAEVSFLQRWYIGPTQLSRSLARFERRGDILCLRLKRKWMIWHNQSWILARSAMDLILQWLAIVKKDRRGVLNSVDLSRVIGSFGL